MEVNPEISSSFNDIKSIIRAQGQEVCRDVINRTYITSRLDRRPTGFIITSPIARAGRRTLRGFQNNNRLNGYALYAIDGKLMDLEIVCSRRDHTVGQFLVESVIARAREEEVSAIQLYCLPMVGLRRWYERLGFRYVNDIVDPTTGENKVCRMQMNL
jgi:hypothetical protein